MSEEEFIYLRNGFLEQYYGEGWEYLLQYIEGITELGNTKCHGFHTDVSGYYDYEEVRDHIEEFDGYWEKVMAEEHTEEESYRLFVNNMSWRYLKQCVLYDIMYTNGTEEQKQEYMANSQQLYDDIMEYDIKFTENADPAFNIYVNPSYWA